MQIMTEAQLDEVDEIVDEDEDDGDDERPGWLVVWKDGEQQVLDLEGTDDEELTEDDILNRWNNAILNGHAFFKIGRHNLLQTDIRYFGLYSDSSFPEIELFDGLQDRVERLLGALEESLQGMAMLSAQQAALQQAQSQLFESIESESDDDEEEEEEEIAPRGKPMQPLKLPGKKPR